MNLRSLLESDEYFKYNTPNSTPTVSAILLQKSDTSGELQRLQPILSIPASKKSTDTLQVPVPTEFYRQRPVLNTPTKGVFLFPHSPLYPDSLDVGDVSVFALSAAPSPYPADSPTPSSMGLDYEIASNPVVDGPSSSSSAVVVANSTSVAVVGSTALRPAINIPSSLGCNWNSDGVTKYETEF